MRTNSLFIYILGAALLWSCSQQDAAPYEDATAVEETEADYQQGYYWDESDEDQTRAWKDESSIQQGEQKEILEADNLELAKAFLKQETEIFLDLWILRSDASTEADMLEIVESELGKILTPEALVKMESIYISDIGNVEELKVVNIEEDDNAFNALVYMTVMGIEYYLKLDVSTVETEYGISWKYQIVDVLELTPEEII